MTHPVAPTPPPTIVVHGRAHVVAALRAAEETGRPVRLASAPGAAAYLGAEAFAAMTQGATATLDCGSDPGLALNALRHGLRSIALAARHPDAGRRVAEIAAHLGAEVATIDFTAALDLRGRADPLTCCRDWLSGQGGQPTRFDG